MRSRDRDSNSVIIVNGIVCVIMLIIAFQSINSPVILFLCAVGGITSVSSVIIFSKFAAAAKRDINLYKNIISNLEPMFDDSQKTLSQYKADFENISTNVKERIDSVKAVSIRVGEIIDENTKYLDSLCGIISDTTGIVPEISSIKDTSKEVFEHLNVIQKEYAEHVNVLNEVRYRIIDYMDNQIEEIKHAEDMVKNIELEASKAGIAALNAAIGVVRPDTDINEISKYFAEYAGNIKISVDLIQDSSKEVAAILGKVKNSGNEEVIQGGNAIDEEDLSVKFSNLNKLSMIINKCNHIYESINSNIEAIRSQIEKQYSYLDIISKEVCGLREISSDIDGAVKKIE